MQKSNRIISPGVQINKCLKFHHRVFYKKTIPPFFQSLLHHLLTFIRQILLQTSPAKCCGNSHNEWSHHSWRSWKVWRWDDLIFWGERLGRVGLPSTTLTWLAGISPFSMRSLRSTILPRCIHPLVKENRVCIHSKIVMPLSIGKYISSIRLHFPLSKLVYQSFSMGFRGTATPHCNIFPIWRWISRLRCQGQETGELKHLQLQLGKICKHFACDLHDLIIIGISLSNIGMKKISIIYSCSWMNITFPDTKTSTSSIRSKLILTNKHASGLKKTLPRLWVGDLPISMTGQPFPWLVSLKNKAG